MALNPSNGFGNPRKMTFLLQQAKWFVLAFLLVCALAYAPDAQANANETKAKSKQSQSVKKEAAPKRKVTKNRSAKKRSTVSSRNKQLRQAASRNKNRVSAAANAARALPDPSKHASLVIDADSGNVIYANNANAVRHPASLTKMMTLYLTFEALEKKRLRWDQDLKVSFNASEQAPTNLFLKPGDTISVREAVIGLIVRSANDAAVVLAEAIGGSEDRFARMMTQKARSLGMKNTTFTNASGLPDKRQITTARDMAALALALRKHYPEHYALFKTRAFSFNGRTYESHNRVLSRLVGADGLKTGYTRMSGFNLVTSARRGGHRLIGVVLGGQTAKSRDDQMVTLMDQSFQKVASLGREKNASVQLASLNESPSSEGVEGQGDASDDRVSTVRFTPPSQVKELPGSAQSQNAPYSPTQSAGSGWGIQVGAFSRVEDAVKAVNRAKQLAPDMLSSATVAITKTKVQEDKLHRARIEALSETQAQSTCKLLIAEQKTCFAYPADAVRDNL